MIDLKGPIDSINVRNKIFHVYRMSESIPSEPGVYIFLREIEVLARTQCNNILYIGQTQNLRERLYTNLDYHEEWPCIRRHRGDCVGVYLMKNSTKQERLDVETELRHTYETPCNRQ